jgi:trk system potassium uptake protein TrkA
VKKQVCVIGLGRFGSTVARELYQSGHDVLAIDVDESKIQEQLGKVTYAVRADATSESVLRELDIPDYDVVIVALGSENVQASVGITVLLKSLNVPLIISRAADELHGNTLERIGADRVLFPEADNARRVARLEFSRELLDYMPILADYGISKVRPPEAMIDHTLEEAELSGSGDRHDISVLAIRRGRTSLLHPARDEVMQSGDVLILAATTEQLSKLPETARRLAESDAKVRSTRTTATRT